MLTGKARAAYVDVDAGAGYPAIKNAILKRFNVTPEGSRVKLREQKCDPQQDPGDMLVTLKTLPRRWILPTDEEFQEEEGAKVNHQKDSLIVDRVAATEYAPQRQEGVAPATGPQECPRHGPASQTVLVDPSGELRWD